MEPQSVTRKLAAIFHADVQGYSRLIGEDEVTTLHTVAAHLDMMRALVRQHGGRAIGSRGDSLLAEFPSVVEAVQCSVEMQQELKIRNAALPVDRRVEFRIGINLGEVVVEGDEIYGDGVNVTVRLESIAEAGGFVFRRWSTTRCGIGWRCNMKTWESRRSRTSRGPYGHGGWY